MKEEKENKTNNVKMAKDELKIKIEFIPRIVTTIYLFFEWNCLLLIVSLFSSIETPPTSAGYFLRLNIERKKHKIKNAKEDEDLIDDYGMLF